MKKRQVEKGKSIRESKNNRAPVQEKGPNVHSYLMYIINKPTKTKEPKAPTKLKKTDFSPKAGRGPWGPLADEEEYTAQLSEHYN